MLVVVPSPSPAHTLDEWQGLVLKMWEEQEERGGAPGLCGQVVTQIDRLLQQQCKHIFV